MKCKTVRRRERKKVRRNENGERREQEGAGLVLQLDMLGISGGLG